MNTNTAAADQTIHASAIQAGDVVETIPSIAGGSVTVTRVTVEAVEAYDINGRTFYDIKAPRLTLTNMTSTYRLIEKANA